MRLISALTLLSSLGLALADTTTPCSSGASSTPTLPIVDLGYQLQQAAGFNVRQYHTSELDGVLTETEYRPLL